VLQLWNDHSIIEIMARPTEFNHQQAIDKALLLFWRKGYQATTMSDLVDAMGISRSSFYGAFQDKRTLFLQCLDLFGLRTCQVLQKARTEMAAIDALQFFFERHLSGPRPQHASLGCLLVNTVLEMSGVDDELSDRASGHLVDMQKLFEECLHDAGCQPEQAQALAGVLMLLNEGVRVASRRRMKLQDQRDPIATTFAMLRQQIPVAT
jgi:TetR/AcrR family transcriptional repressor of nem operon